MVEIVNGTKSPDTNASYIEELKKNRSVISYNGATIQGGPN